MSKRNGVTRFSAVPANVDIQRSRFDRSSSLKTSLSAGKLVPFYLDEVLPGDTFEMKTNYLARMSTPLTPVMDTAFLDMYYFFVPMRLIWDHWKQFNGESDDAWTSNVEYTIPGFKPTKHADSYSLADYFGLPAGQGYGSNVSTHKINILPLRAYQLIWNEWFRDQNTQDPVLINKGDTVSVKEERDFLYAVGNNGHLLPMNKKHDYFTSCLPAPQKGEAVQFGDDFSPVGARFVSHDLDDFMSALRFNTPGIAYNSDLLGRFLGPDNVIYTGAKGPGLTGGGMNWAMSTRNWTYDINDQKVENYPMVPSNLWADTRGLSFTVNQLRQAFAVQRMYERDARSGTRYREFVKAHFGVTIPDATVQVPEYLGGECVPLTVNQVVQMSGTTPDVETPLGNTGAFSKTVGRNASFTKSFTEHGYIIGVMGVRTMHTYQQGINRLWSRQSRLDFYLPVLANLGEMPVYTKEIYSSDDIPTDDVFGYQEAWADYRYKPSLVTGAMRSTAPDSLDIWHYADYFQDAPVLSDGFIKETTKNIDRTLVVQSDISHQVFIDFYFDLQCVRPMPLYSVPGLIDHH